MTNNQKTVHVTVKCLDGDTVQLGDHVWVNHHTNARGPVRARLLAVRHPSVEGGEWPYKIEADGGGVSWWSHCYSSFNAAAKADPGPVLDDLRHKLADTRDVARQLLEQLSEAYGLHLPARIQKLIKEEPWLEPNEPEGESGADDDL